MCHPVYFIFVTVNYAEAKKKPDILFPITSGDLAHLPSKK